MIDIKTQKNTQNKKYIHVVLSPLNFSTRSEIIL